MQFMKLNILLRPSLAVVFGFIGALVARGGTPPTIFAITGEYFLVIAVLSFGTLGFILPELVELAAKAGIAAMARQIAAHLPTPDVVGAATGAISQFKKTRRNRLRKKYVNPIVLDTSVLVEGRILDVVRTGFIFGTLLVVPSVVAELHKLADSADLLKRAKGRRGLDYLKELGREKGVKVEMLSREPEGNGVDSILVKLSKQTRAKLLTLDFNLNKVGQASGVKILNLNELANAVKTAVLPHETLTIHVNTVGREKDQGVGYLADGTMVVVEGGAKYKGKTVDIEVLRVIQTAAGKMIFGKSA